MPEGYFQPCRLLGGAEAAQAIAAGDALPLAGGPLAFSHVALLERMPVGTRGTVLPVGAMPGAAPHPARGEWDAWRARTTAPRAALAGLDLATARVMGIVNVTPDSFSDGGHHADTDSALAHALVLVEEGADILDIGGESTRPGAPPVPLATERERVMPVIRGLAGSRPVPISVDTRKPGLMREAAAAGAAIVNDVSALRAPGAVAAVRDAGTAVVLMHMQGEPATMQDAPRYDDVLLDVYDHLAERVDACVAAGIDRARIVVDPGIGFGKTFAHNLRLMGNLSLFHGLGCAVLLGASRKGFLGRLAGGGPAQSRLPGSLAAVLVGRRQGVQLFRVHDVAATKHALTVWSAPDAIDACKLDDAAQHFVEL